MAVQRVAVGAASPKIRVTFRDGYGTPTTPTGAVTVGVVDWAGTVLLAPLTATTIAETGVYEVVLPAAAVASPTQLTATWSATGVALSTTVDVVGSRLVWPEEFLSSPGVTGRGPAELSDAIAWFEDLAYRYLNWSPIVRFAERSLRSPAAFAGGISIPDPFVVSLLGVTWHQANATVDTDVVATEEELALLDVTAAGLLWGSYLTSWATVAYTHGNPDGAADLHDAALTAIRLHLLENTAGRPTLSVANDLGGTTRFSTAGAGRPSGIPEVDEVLNGLRHPVCA